MSITLTAELDRVGCGCGCVGEVVYVGRCVLGYSESIVNDEDCGDTCCR